MPEPTTPPTPNATTTTEPADDGKGGKSAILADLATERDKRQALELQVQQMQTTQLAQAEALAKAFGLKPEEGASDVTALAGQVTALREQFATTQHENLVLSVANANGITDEADLAILRSVKDEATVKSLAARLKANAATAHGPGTPKPDLTQGGRAEQKTASPAADFAAFLNNQLGR